MRQLLLLLYLVPFTLTAQPHAEFWSKLSAVKLINSYWAFGIDVQYRQQANYRKGDKNILHYPMGRSVSSWIYYNLKDQWQIILSPAGWFKNEDISNNNDDVIETTELRQVIGASKTVEIRRIKNKNRLFIEIRFIDFDNSKYHKQSRCRVQNSLTIPLHKKEKLVGLNYYFSNELFIKKQKSITRFDQNRVYNALQWKFKHTDVDMGYQWVVQQSASNTFQRHQLFIMLNLYL